MYKNDILKQIGINLINSLVTISILFTFISIFVFNIQIQDFNVKGELIDTHSIVQVDLLLENLRAYFFEI